MKRLAVIGAGSWGTALAQILSPRFAQTRLWVFESDLAERIARYRVNDVYLPGQLLRSEIEPTPNLAHALENSDIVLSVTPSHHTRAIFEQLRPHARESMLFVSATKGLENGSLQRMTEVIRETLQPAFTPRTGALSGPTFAKEVAAGEPAAIVIASQDADLAQQIQKLFSGPTFRVYTNNDPIGVEIGASLKNVIALAAGVAAGLGLGANTMAALVTRGLAEMSRLAVAAGGNPRTLAGLAGLGDLVLTCNGELSRNRQVGLRLGRGEKIADILASMKMVAEGVKTTAAALALAAQYNVEMPITTQIGAILDHNRDPREALRELMERSPKEEFL